MLEIVYFLQVSIQHSDRRRASIQVEDHAAFKFDTRHSIKWKAGDDDVHTIMMVTMATQINVFSWTSVTGKNGAIQLDRALKRNIREKSSSAQTYLKP